MELRDKELSKAPAEISQCVAEKEWEEFHDKLEDFPHSFQLENQEQLIPDTLKRLKKGIESALSVGLKTSLETARARNLLAYLLFCLGHPADSLAQTDEALSVDGQQQNIVSLANRAVILWQTGRRDDAGKQVELLQDLKSDKGFSYLHVKARAELAFCYTRMGPRFFSKAIAVFKDVLEQAKEPEKWLWTFGLALTKRRCLRLQLAPYMQEHDRRGEFFATLKSFQTVLENTQCTNLKAKTFAELAMLPSMTTDTQIKADLMAAMHGMSPKDCCEQALQLDGNDVSVLTKCGMIFGKEKNFTRAIGILTKAVSLRKSSRSYHHIGLAYKALAKSAEQDGGGAVRDICLTEKPQATTLDNTILACKLHTSAEPDLNITETFKQTVHLSESETSDANAQLSAKVTVESSHKHAASLSVSDKNILLAIQYMENAANYSEGENTIAIFDLALLYKELGHLHKALELLEEIMYCRKILFCDPYRINAYEEAGLILKEISEKEKAKDKKQQLRGQAEAMLNMALTLASRVYSKVAQVEEHRGEIHLSFSTLLKAVEDSDNKAQEKLWQKARLFKLIKDHKQSLNLLRDMAKMDPAEENKPARLKMCVENYMDMQQYENAVAFIELLQCTSAAAQLFEDKHYVQKVYVQAAKQALLLSSSTARSHFHAAFVDTYTDTKQTTSSSDDSDFTENKQDTWDVMILCEQESESKAEQLTKLLEDACGLKVTYCDKHVRPGTLKVKGVLQIMKRSRLVVVLIGSDKASVELDFFINIAVLRPSTVTLLVEHNRNRVPQLLKAHRRMPCPGGLLDVTQQQGRPYSQSTIDGICKLFSFFINIGE